MIFATTAPRQRQDDEARRVYRKALHKKSQGADFYATAAMLSHSGHRGKEEELNAIL
jgi:hypothetical protein